jgi:hypothetical protein
VVCARCARVSLIPLVENGELAESVRGGDWGWVQGAVAAAGELGKSPKSMALAKLTMMAAR